MSKHTNRLAVKAALRDMAELDMLWLATRAGSAARAAVDAAREAAVAARAALEVAREAAAARDGRAGESTRSS